MAVAWTLPVGIALSPTATANLPAYCYNWVANNGILISGSPSSLHTIAQTQA